MSDLAEAAFRAPLPLQSGEPQNQHPVLLVPPRPPSGQATAEAYPIDAFAKAPSTWICKACNDLENGLPEPPNARELGDGWNSDNDIYTEQNESEPPRKLSKKKERKIKCCNTCLVKRGTTKTRTEATVIGPDHTDTGGQVVHRFVNNFHIHHDGERTVCGNCGDEKACRRCSNVGKEQCKICGLWMMPQNVVHHQRVHSRERPFECDQCPSSFTQKTDLRRHMWIHTGEKPYLCEVCGMQFRRPHHLTVHQTSIHSDKRIFDCSCCGKRFKRRDQLMQHKREVHKFVYTCPECKDHFGTRNEFSEHHSAVHVREAELMREHAEMKNKMDDSSECYSDN